MATAQQVADRLAQLLRDSQPVYRTDATKLTVQLGSDRREIYLAPQEGQPRGIQSR